MTRSKFPLILSLLVLLVAMMAYQPVALAQQSNPSNPPAADRDSMSQQAPAAGQTSDSQTFTGKIAKAGGKYVLKDEATKTMYTLDDQDQAKKFEGKAVKVTGKLDAASNTIRVAAIEPGS